MNSFAKDVSFLLTQDTGLALVEEKDLFYNRMPPSPQNAVTVFNNPGEPPMLQLQQAQSNYFYGSVSVWVRNIDADVAWEKSQAILEYLHGLNNTVLDTVLYMLIKAEGNPQLLHYDENDRAVYIVNYTVQRRTNN